MGFTGAFGPALLAAAGLGAAAALLTAPMPVFLLAGPVAVSVFQFCLTPLLTLFGIFRYHSPMLKATVRTDRLYEIHAGTTFDFVARLRWSDRGPAAARLLLVWFLEGLLDIASLVERGELPPTIRVVGTSYFFREATAVRLGFSVHPASLRLRLNLLLNLLDITCMYSFTRGRVALPNVFAVKEAAILGGELVARKGEIGRLIERLAPRRPRRRGAEASAAPRG